MKRVLDVGNCVPDHTAITRFLTSQFKCEVLQADKADDALPLLRQQPVDLIVVNRHAPAQLWRNSGGDAGNWVQFALEQEGANRDAIGAWLEVRCGDRLMRREISVGGGHASGQLGWRHFGLGEEDAAEVRVVWPDGEADEWQPVEAGRFYVIRRGGAPETWTAKP